MSAPASTTTAERVGRIYKITCLANGKVYVGQTTQSLRQRWNMHMHHVKAGRSCALQNAIRKFGAHRFRIELLEECPASRLNERETHWIAELRSHDPEHGYNRTFGGYEPLTPEARDVLSRKVKRNTFLLTFDGRTQHLAAWARETGITESVISRRIKRGWSVARALTEKPGRERTHCVLGHELTPENTYTSPKSGRRCRICKSSRARDEYASAVPTHRRARMEAACARQGVTPEAWDSAWDACGGRCSGCDCVMEYGPKPRVVLSDGRVVGLVCNDCHRTIRSVAPETLRRLSLMFDGPEVR